MLLILALLKEPIAEKTGLKKASIKSFILPESASCMLSFAIALIPGNDELANAEMINRSAQYYSGLYP